MGFTEFMFKYLPGYNKFRTVSMILVVIEWTVPLLAALALMPLWRGEIPRQKLLKALAWAGGVTGGICLLFALVGGTLFGFGRTESNELMSWQYYQMFQAAGMEDAIAQGVPEELGEVTADAMAVDRAAILRTDAWRSLLMIALAAGSVLLFALGRLKRGGLVAALTVIVLIDLIPVNLRYLPQSRFVTGRQNKIVQTEADRAILRDPELGFRVLNLTVSPFNDATTSYFHRSVGGYHGAKLARYQDLIERYLSSMDEGVLDMLNTRYVIQYDQTNGRPTAYLRQTANGAAWFVDGIVDVSTPHEEIDALGYTDLKTTAVINTDEFGNTLPTAGGKGEIRLTEYRPNYLKYQYTADAPALAVFSEIYFNDGWEAFIDGKEAHYLRADYVLRAMELPAGTHTVEWRFRAPHWTLIEGITLVSSLAILGGLLVTVILVLRHERRQKTQA